MLDILLLNYNDSQTTISFVDSVREFHSVRHILIVDNNSTDNSIKILRQQFENVNDVEIIVTDHNGGYGFGNNYGIRYLINNYQSDYILQCNPDTIICEECINHLVNALETNKDIAIIAPVMLDRSKRVSIYDHYIPSLRDFILSMSILFNKFNKRTNSAYVEKPGINEVEIVAGSLLMYNAALIMECGLYDENVFLYGEEIIQAFRVRDAGYKEAILSGDYFIHNHSVTISKTYKSAFAKFRIMVKSNMYIIKQYYKATTIQYAMAKLFSYIGMTERLLLSVAFKR